MLKLNTFTACPVFLMALSVTSLWASGPLTYSCTFRERIQSGQYATKDFIVVDGTPPSVTTLDNGQIVLNVRTYLGEIILELSNPQQTLLSTTQPSGAFFNLLLASPQISVSCSQKP